MEQRGKRRPVHLPTLQGWEAEIFNDALPSDHRQAPYGVEVAALKEWGFTYNATRDEDRAALRGVSWSWPTACAWVAWRTLDGAASGVAAFRTWRGRVWREGEFDARPGRLMELWAAELDLRNALEAGKLSADAVRGGEVVAIGPGEWPRLAWEANPHGEVIEFDRLLMLGAPRYEGVTLARAAVMRLWPALDRWAPDGAAGAVEEPSAAADTPLDVPFRPVAEKAPVAEVAALAGPDPVLNIPEQQGEKASSKPKRAGKGTMGVASKARNEDRAEQIAVRERTLRRALAERPNLTVTQGERLLKAEHGPDFPASRGTVQATMAAIKGEVSEEK